MNIEKIINITSKCSEILPKLLKIEKSFCPFCGKVINSQIVEISGRVFLKKGCCGREMLYFLENDVDFFLNGKKFNIEEKIPKATTYMEWLQNSERDIHALYLYITLRCNLNCPICYLKFDGFLKDESRIEYDLPLDIIKRIVDKTSAEIIIFTGGEPTLHPNLPHAIKYVKKKGKKAAILTNGLRLIDKEYLKTLVNAGIDKIGLSFDGFDDHTYKLLRGKPLLREKLEALKNLKEFNIKVTLVPVIAKGINENEVPKIIQFAAKNIRFINQIVFVSLRTKEFSLSSTAPSDIIKIVSKYIGGFKPKDIHVYTKFYYNLHRVLNKFLSWIVKEDVAKVRTSFLIPGYDLLLEVNKGKIRLLFSPLEVKKINRELEKVYIIKSRIRTIIAILKNIRLFTKLPVVQLLQAWLRKRTFSGYDILDNSKNLLRIHFNEVKSLHTLMVSERKKIRPSPPVITFIIAD